MPPPPVKRAASAAATFSVPPPGPAFLHPVPGCGAGLAVGWRDSAQDVLRATLVLPAGGAMLPVPHAYQWSVLGTRAATQPRFEVLYRALAGVAVIGVAAVWDDGGRTDAVGGAWLLPRDRADEAPDALGAEDASPEATRAMLLGAAAFPHISGALFGGQVRLGLASHDPARPRLRPSVAVGRVVVQAEGESTLRVVTGGLPHPVALGAAVSAAALFADRPRRVVAAASAAEGFDRGDLGAALGLGFSRVLRAVFATDDPDAVRAHLAACLTGLGSSGDSHRVEHAPTPGRVVFTSAPTAPLPLPCLQRALDTAHAGRGARPAVVELDVAGDLPDVLLAVGAGGDRAELCALHVATDPQTGEVEVRIACSSCAVGPVPPRY